METKTKKMSTLEINQSKGGAEMKDRIGFSGLGILLAGPAWGEVGAASVILSLF